MKPSLVFVSFVVFAHTLWAETTETPDFSDGEAVQTAHCPAPPSDQEVAEIVRTTAVCSPMTLAIGGSALRRTAPATAAAMARLLGPLGRRLVLGMNVVGGTLAAVEILGLLYRGANGIEQCRTQEIDFKRQIIIDSNARGERFREALEGAGFTLTDQQRRQLQFPPAYSEPDRLNNILCGELVQMGRHMDERQNRVYLELTSGTMRNVPIPPEPSREMSESDQRLLQEFVEGLQCLEAEDYIRGVCAIGAFVSFGRPLPGNIARRGIPDLKSNRLFQMVNARTRQKMTSIQNGFTSGQQRNPTLTLEAYLMRRGTDRFRSLNPQNQRRVMQRARRCLSPGSRR